jgi:hypothetical protein
MGTKIFKQEIVKVKVGQEFNSVKLLRYSQLNSFKPDLLGLGDISKHSSRTEAIAAIFDLSGFTKFCSQNDPHLCVPDYLSNFLTWLFNKIKEETVNETYPAGKTLWCDLPFMAKFLGDGVLFLWDTGDMDNSSICNVVVSLGNICDSYKNDFLSTIKQVVADPPDILRCGIARGSVFSVGDAQDYVGPCINIAARLQKFSTLTFCVDKKGFDFNKYMDNELFKKYILKSIPIRGIRNQELVWVRKEEFANLPPEELKLFSDP